MAYLKVGRFSISFICSMVLIGYATGYVKTKRDSSHVGYLYDAPQHGFGFSSLKETEEVQKEIEKEIKESIEEKLEEEIEQAKEEAKEEVKQVEEKLLHQHSREYIPPINHGHEHEHEHKSVHHHH